VIQVQVPSDLNSSPANTFPSNSLQKLPLIRLSYFLATLVVLSGCIALTGCGGLAPSSTSTGTSSTEAGSFTASPTTVAFGSVTIGSPATSHISLVNSSSNPVVISQLSVSSKLFSYDGVGTLPYTLAGNSTATLNVHFAPSAAGSASAQLVIASNAAGGPSTTVQMTGAGVAVAAAPPVTGAGLEVSSSTVAFGNVPVGTTSTQSITLTSTGTAAVVVSGAKLSGTGFTLSGTTFPLTLTAGATATLSLQFDPAAAGAATGSLTISSDASSNGTAIAALSGTGVPLAVDLSWNAPSDAEIAGFNIYRATGSSSSFSRVNTSLTEPATYMDATVQAGITYQYYVTTVDSTGAESVPSNTATVVTP
jgi:ASPM-SPD-2-Hydin domain-containing protein/centrosomal CEP192-like protein